VWSVTARQWHTYTRPRLGQPDLMVKVGPVPTFRVAASSSVLRRA
jgi:hypothetical protein